MKLILIRHGNTEANEKHLYCGSTDLPLSEAGRASLAPRTLPALPDLRIVTSGLARCEQTLEELYGVMPHETDAAFREMDFGAFEMRSYEELKNDPAFIEWCTGDNERNVCPNGESGEQVTERALAALWPIIEAGEDAVVVTHGGVIGGVLARLFPNPRGRYLFTPAPGTGFTVEFEGRTPVGYCKTPAGSEENE